ncbi:hypothetical protein DSCW_30830 [Desulfosarcina widdelii]|uniref:AAA+ ATPase domain-containing protein n=1 Tax=Desulfosarcina widdelii TaxID=947919 RepID=A0A5K7Z1W0_9BACT|nr:AAA family ATPase [Desulfosarcina widdelii]BBO75666.1 hypothetical protein DSCW_30830 [Desulfosarcina widdelii]
MYLRHYHLEKKPFDLAPNPTFLWLGEKHNEALSTLKYGVFSDMGFLLLTGDVGVGKTALIHRLISEIDPATIVAFITDPGVSIHDFFRLLYNEYKIDKEFRNKAEFLIEFEKFLRRSDQENKSVLLIVDEAQRLSHKLLDEIRVLSNIERNDRKLINIFFVGQPEFIDLVTDNKNRAIRQRIAINYHIQALNEDETGQYITHRLKVAGAVQPIFTPDAFSEIFRLTDGYPRAINILCNHALIEGYASGIQTIDAETVRKCKQDVNIRSGKTVKHTDVQRSPKPVLREKMPHPADRSTARWVSPWLLAGILVAAVTAYYFLRFEPHWTNRNNTQTQIAESIRPPEKITEIETLPTPEKIEIFVSAPKIEKIDHSKEANVKDRPASSDQPQPMIIARATSPPVSSPKEPAETVPPSIAAPASPPEWSNWPDAGKQGKRSYGYDGQETLDNRTEDATGDTTATDQSVTSLEDDGQQTFSEKKIEGYSGKTTQDNRGSNLQDELPLQKEVPKPETSAAKEKPKDEDEPPTPIKATIENLTAQLPADHKNDSQSFQSDEPVPPSTGIIALAGSQTKAPKNNITPSENAAVKPDSATAKEKNADASSTTKPRSEHQEQSSSLALKEGSLKPAAVDQTPSPETAAPEKLPPVNLPETTMASKSDALLERPTNRSGAGSAPVEEPDVNLMEDRLRSFLNLYCSTYAEKNLDGFTSFFTANALENGKPFESLLPKYKRNFTYIDKIQYQIELQQFTYDKSEKIVKIEGDFFLKWLPSGKNWRENSGKIFMDLQKNGSTFLVQRLNYFGHHSQKK